MQLDSICSDPDDALNARSPFSIPNPLVQINQQPSDSPEHDLLLLHSPQLDPETLFAFTADLPPSSEAFASDDFNHDPPSANVQHSFASKQSSRFNPFSTPGPKFAAVHRPGVYFDSPIEDPSDSDPLDPFQGYQIEELDYKWKPFLRHGRHPELDNTSSNHVFSDIPDVELPRDVSTPLESTDTLTSDIGSFDMSSPSPKPTPEIEQQVRVATPEMKAPAVFAPGPGIFISPLRGSASTPPESGPHPEQPKSQVIFAIFLVSYLVVDSTPDTCTSNTCQSLKHKTCITDR
ncbi:hypothetical protein FIBSPDRAFT_10522 [Athelia psychrophila]|uniref:Uncharacterized protein n=1 Tax=Athelia psychrophila TaxID=1759441 RepID=A0A166X840_9AGAM|nr:hypothetical protein FIBSPDRAFT_10522 [Fibularhizoctonia sp. CBS 109695]